MRRDSYKCRATTDDDLILGGRFERGVRNEEEERSK